LFVCLFILDIRVYVFLMTFCHCCKRQSLPITGPECPVATSKTTPTFSLQPIREGSNGGYCFAGQGTIGYTVNGVYIYGWSDAQSYNNTGYWYNLAPIYEFYDMDICFGHSDANGNYHHHTYSSCLAAKLRDVGNGHSPIYGWIRDGFPIYGPWQANKKLAVPCWKLRDYSKTSATGCSDGKRSCILTKEYDYETGSPVITTMSTSKNNGPPLPPTISYDKSSSGTYIKTDVGVFYQDYYYDKYCFAANTVSNSYVYLNEFNGHDHDDLGFHYHMVTDTAMNPIFPYTMGPMYYGYVGGLCCYGMAGTNCKGTSSASTSTSFATRGKTDTTCKGFNPTALPTRSPTIVPTNQPTFRPTNFPTVRPTNKPSRDPTEDPSDQPSYPPTFNPTLSPTVTLVKLVHM